MAATCDSPDELDKKSAGRMLDRQKLVAGELEVGYEFPTVSYQLEPDLVATYIEAVGAGGSLSEGLVPPTALATYAMAILLENMSMPSGTIHTNQELEFKGAVSVGEIITCNARVSRNQERGKFHFLNIDIDVLDKKRRSVLAGKASFILP